MKRIITLSCLAIALIISVQACKKKKKKPTVNIPCISAGLQSSVMAFYPFSNGSINDFSGNNHHLSNTTTASPSADRNGNPNCAFEFDASAGEFLSTANTGFLDGLSQFSVSLWYQPLDTSRNAIYYEVLISRDKGGSCPDRWGQWSVSLYDCRKAVFGRTNSVWDADLIAFTCDSQIYARTGSWHHLAATIDLVKSEMKIYRDGVLQDSAFGSGGCPSYTPQIKDIGDLFLGTFYIGRLDDVILFKTALTQSEVQELNSMGTCCSQ